LRVADQAHALVTRINFAVHHSTRNDCIACVMSLTLK
jgi:hypothetical protein